MACCRPFKAFKCEVSSQAHAQSTLFRAGLLGTTQGGEYSWERGPIEGGQGRVNPLIKTDTP